MSAYRLFRLCDHNPVWWSCQPCAARWAFTCRPPIVERFIWDPFGRWSGSRLAPVGFW